MTEVKVYSSTSYLESHAGIVYPRIVLVFDAAELQDLDDQSAVWKLLDLSDITDIQKIKQLSKKVKPSSDSAASLESFFSCGTEKVLTRVVIVVLPVNFSLPYADDAVHSAPEIQLYLSTVNDETPLLKFPNAAAVD